MTNNPTRHVPVRPNLEQLRNQAKDLLKAHQSGDPAALQELPTPEPKLADAQLALARSYGLASWPRLVTACQLIEAIWENNIETVRKLVVQNPKLLTEDARGVPGNWGPPMSYAANVGRNEIVEMLRDIGSQDVQFAFDRACLQGKLDTARLLFGMGGRPQRGSVMGPCETLSGTGLALLLELGAEFCDDHDDRLAPVALTLQTYTRNPEGKHACLEIAANHVELPDTAPMAVHRGRIDLLEAHLRRDPDLLTRTFSHKEIFPAELGCHTDETLALHGTPLGGATLLHIAVDYDEFEIVEWILSNGGPVDAKAAIDADGFGGHTALFGCIVWQPHHSKARPSSERYVRMFLDHGANVNARASLRKALRFVEDESLHEYINVTPRGWGERFHDQAWVDRKALALVRAEGGEL
jgi:ankyrin repeat protein